jgi:prepilin-type N-terminal cleavage/methylation domain-containing protein
MRRKAFSLIELLVVITIIVMLVAMLATAMNSARASGKKQTTKSAIAAINAILQRHFASCESTPLSAADATTDIGVSIRRKITADMPDNWAEVAYMKTLPAEFSSARQRGYVATYNAINPSPAYSNAECLFMIVMQGGLADCLACTSLDSVQKGDYDGDGALEFWDAWGEPIQYVLWPAGFELPLETNYFDQVAPFSGLLGTGATGGLMRPLVFSGGPSKLSSTMLNDGSYLLLGNDCGNPAYVPPSVPPDPRTFGGHDGGTTDSRSDNITNYDDTVKK